MTSQAITPATAALTITAYGIPITQGSKRLVGRGRMIDDRPGLKAWRRAVGAAAREAAQGAPPLDGPLVVEITATVPKPASAPKRRASWPVTRSSGDVDKLARAVFDALAIEGAVIVDDSRVVELTARKVYPGEGVDSLDAPGVVVHVWHLADAP